MIFFLPEFRLIQSLILGSVYQQGVTFNYITSKIFYYPWGIVPSSKHWKHEILFYEVMCSGSYRKQCNICFSGSSFHNGFLPTRTTWRLNGNLEQYLCVKSGKIQGLKCMYSIQKSAWPISSHPTILCICAT